MNYIPIMINVSDRRVVIIGGGNAAYKKVKNLLNHDRNITVIASDFDPKFSDFQVEKIKMRIQDPGQVDDFLKGDNIVIIATDDPHLNQTLEDVCKRRHLLYNRVDDARSPFIFPASFESNGVIISVSTMGRAPSLTRYIRDKTQERIRELPMALPVVEKLRNDCNIPGMREKAAYFRKLFDDAEFWEHISNGRTEEAYALGMDISKKESGK